MKLEQITLTDLIAVLENVPELFKLNKYNDVNFVRKHLALFIHRNGFYGTENSIGELKSLERNKTKFVSSKDITIVIEGVVDLDRVPEISGGGSIIYKGKGALEVNGATLYDGRLSVGGSVNWGDVMGNILDQTDLQIQFNTKANSSHTHTESEITDLDKYTQAQIDSFLSGKADTVHGHNDTQITNNSTVTGATTKDALDNVDLALGNKSDVGHGHDDTEINNTSAITGATVKDALDTISTGKANTSHTHTKSQITDFAHALSEHSDVPNKPNNGNKNVLVEENNTLTWEQQADQKIVSVQFSLTESVYNSDRYFFLSRSSSTGTGTTNRSGSDLGYGDGGTCPFLIPFDAKVIGAEMRAGRLGAGGVPAATVGFNTELRNLNLTDNGTELTPLNFDFDSGSVSIGDQAVADTDGRSTIDLSAGSVTVSAGDLIGLKADYNSTTNRIVTSDNVYVTVYLEKV